MLPIAYRDELERIVFFNPEQDRVTESIIDSVHRYGVPLIVEEEETLRFRVPAFGPVQTLYALDSEEQPARLAGVVMFFRESLDTVLFLHMAVHEDYGAEGVHSEMWVTPRLLTTVRNACRRVRGITCMRLLYPHEVQVKLERLSA
jgi:hypothetical protein